MSTQSKSFHLSLLFHLALAAVLFYGHQLLEEDTPPLVIDFSLALSEAMAGEPDQPPGPPAEGAAKAPAPQSQPQAQPPTHPPETIIQPVQKPVKIAKKQIKKTKPKPKPKKVRKEPVPMVETSTKAAPLVKTESTAANSSAAAENGAAPASASTSAATTASSKGGQSSASAGSGDKGSRGGGSGMKYDFNYVRQRILRNLQFPATARKMGLTGKIVVSFVLKADGQVEGITVVTSSGHDILDNTVVATIRRVAPFPKPPASAQLMLPIVFHLKS
ncbi:MAG: energy transducer TonB [Desulfobulbus sp.]